MALRPPESKRIFSNGRRNNLSVLPALCCIAILWPILRIPQTISRGLYNDDICRCVGRADHNSFRSAWPAFCICRILNHLFMLSAGFRARFWMHELRAATWVVLHLPGQQLVTPSATSSTRRQKPTTKQTDI